MWVTSISFPVSDDITRDSSGFPTHNKTLIQNIPANRQDVTRSDELLARQVGYTADCVYEVDKAAYPIGCGTLIDEADDIAYNIRRVFRPEKGNSILLTCEVRERGKI